MSRRLAVGSVALAAVGVAALVIALWPSGEHAAQVPDSGRTVLVAAGGDPLPATAFYALRDCLGNPTTCVNGAEGIVLAYRVSGPLPHAPMSGTVMTDENCEPDRHGVSHCLNRMRLDGGETLVVRHDHNMGNDPCLAPGERVTVRALA